MLYLLCVLVSTNQMSPQRRVLEVALLVDSASHLSCAIPGSVRSCVGVFCVCRSFAIQIHFVFSEIVGGVAYWHAAIGRWHAWGSEAAANTYGRGVRFSLRRIPGAGWTRFMGLSNRDLRGPAPVAPTNVPQTSSQP